MGEDTDVIIVGAGLAGLRAAQVLNAAGVEVEMFDAAAQVGGRVTSSVVDGFVLDEGFQLINPAYPELRATGVLADFDLRRFAPVVEFGDGGRTTAVADPRAGLVGAMRSLRHPELTVRDAVRLARLLTEVARRPVSRLTSAPDTTTRRALAERGISERAIDGVIQPFLRGALLDDALETSWHYSQLVLKSLVRGRPGTHPRGVGALPVALAATLSRTRLHLGEEVTSVTANEVASRERRRRARTVIVASDPSSARRLLGGSGDVAWRAQTTWWWSLPSLRDSDRLRVDTRRRFLSSALDVSSVAPERAPRGRSLVAASANVVGATDDDAVRADVARLYGVAAGEVHLIRRTPVPRALPVVASPLDLRRTQDVKGIIVAGDYLQTPSIQGALVSGRRAAGLALSRLRESRRP